MPPLRFVVFTLEGQCYALPLEAIERIVSAVAVTSLPEAPAIVVGAINVQGDILPVINLRRLNQLPARDIQSEDEFILARFPDHDTEKESTRRVALWVDNVAGVLECSSGDVLPVTQLFTGIENLSGAIRRDEGMILIQDLQRALFSREMGALQAALDTKGHDSEPVAAPAGKSSSSGDEAP